MNADVKVEIVKPQKGPQTAFVECTSVDVVCYGGARGGGKSWAMALDFWLHAERHGLDAKGLMLRKTREDLKDFIDLASRMYGPAARYAEKGNVFRFENGAKLFCAYLENERDAQAYQGWSLTRVYVDEVTQLHSLDPVLALLATLRSAKGVRGQMKLTCNPGGPSHNAVKEMFVDNGPYNVVVDRETGLTRVFIPAKVTDNPALLEADPRYIERLKASARPSASAPGWKATGMSSRAASFRSLRMPGTLLRRSQSRAAGSSSEAWIGVLRRRLRCTGGQSARKTPNTMAAWSRVAR